MENNQPLVSVIMNCYNSDKYLREAIDSVLEQTYQNWEIIFWDNQSTDRSAEIVKSYDDERIKYFYAHEHTLLGEARNLAVEKASGKWIGFLDCDDLWYSNKLEIQIQNVSNDIGIIYSRMEFLIEETGIQTNMGKSISKKIYPKRKTLPIGEIFDKLLFECFIPLPSVLIRSELFNQVGGIDSSLKVAEDYDIFLKIAKISKVKAIDNVLCKYRVHENNLSHQNMEKTFEESIKLVKKYFQVRFAKEAISYWNCKKEYYKDSSNILSKLKYVFKVLFNKARGIL
ncbi:glycosyltransferase [Aliarcobacter cryaerophilus]|uniref:glycosyltransferase n=1 Tax=Aliarcobacter cryaerophilus TaxID=28198 RepID=UPI003DA581A2